MSKLIFLILLFLPINLYSKEKLLIVKLYDLDTKKLEYATVEVFKIVEDKSINWEEVLDWTNFKQNIKEQLTLTLGVQFE